MSCVFFAVWFQDFCEISLGFLEIFKGFLRFFKNFEDFFNFQDFYDFNLIRFWDFLEIFKDFEDFFLRFLGKCTRFFRVIRPSMSTLQPTDVQTYIGLPVLKPRIKLIFFLLFKNVHIFGITLPVLVQEHRISVHVYSSLSLL